MRYLAAFLFLILGSIVVVSVRVKLGVEMTGSRPGQIGYMVVYCLYVVGFCKLMGSI